MKYFKCITKITQSIERGKKEVSQNFQQLYCTRCLYKVIFNGKKLLNWTVISSKKLTNNMAHIHQIRILYDEMFCIKYKLITSNYQVYIYININTNIISTKFEYYLMKQFIWKQTDSINYMFKFRKIIMTSICATHACTYIHTYTFTSSESSVYW